MGKYICQSKKLQKFFWSVFLSFLINDMLKKIENLCVYYIFIHSLSIIYLYILSLLYIYTFSLSLSLPLPLSFLIVLIISTVASSLPFKKIHQNISPKHLVSFQDKFNFKINLLYLNICIHFKFLGYICIPEYLTCWNASVIFVALQWHMQGINRLLINIILYCSVFSQQTN